MRFRLSHTLLVVLAVAPGLSAYDAMGVEIHGFVSQGYLQTARNDGFLVRQSNQGSWDYREAGINFSTSPTENLRIGAQFYARDLGDLGNDKVELDWAYGDYKVHDAFGIRAGRYKIPRGLYNEVQDYDALRTSVFLPQSVYNVRLRDFYSGMNGAQIYGRIDLGAAGAFTYQGCLGNNNYDTENGAVAYYFNNALSAVGNSLPGFLLGLGPAGGTVEYKTTDLRSDYIMAASVGWESTFGLRLGVAAISTRKLTGEGYFLVTPTQTSPVFPATSSRPFDITVDDWKSWVFSAEYVLDDLTIASELTQEAINVGDDDPMISGGGYVSANYRVHPKVEVGTYYSVAIADLNDRDGSDRAVDYSAWTRDTALSVRYDVVPGWIMKLEGHFVDGTSMLSRGLSEQSQFERYWYYGAVKASYSF
jgi:hypothetical protein